MDLFDILKSVAEWFDSGIYSFAEEFTGWFFSKLLIWWFEMQLSGIKFAWAVAKVVLENLQISQWVSTGWAALPTEVMETAKFFRLPEAVNLIISGASTRLVMNFIPGM